MDGWKERSAGGEREERIGQIYREREGMEGKKIKQIGMQHTTTGGWNKGGVKLGQLGVPAPGERVGSILSLSLSFSRLLVLYEGQGIYKPFKESLNW